MAQVSLDGSVSDTVSQVPAVGRVPLALNTAAQAGRWFVIIATAAGNVSVTFADGSVGIYPVPVGMTTLPIAITKVNSTGTTATATFENWM